MMCPGRIHRDLCSVHVKWTPNLGQVFKWDTV